MSFLVRRVGNNFVFQPTLWIPLSVSPEGLQPIVWEIFSIQADNIDGLFPLYQRFFIGLSHPNTIDSRSYLSFLKLMLAIQLSFLVADHSL